MLLFDVSVYILDDHMFLRPHCILHGAHAAVKLAAIATGRAPHLLTHVIKPLCLAAEHSAVSSNVVKNARNSASIPINFFISYNLLNADFACAEPLFVELLTKACVLCCQMFIRAVLLDERLAEGRGGGLCQVQDNRNV